MTDYSKPISSSNPPESKGKRDVQIVDEPVEVDGAKKKVLPKEKKTKEE